MIIHIPYPPFKDADSTSPEAAAWIGVPSGAAMSMPLWKNVRCRIGCIRIPKPLVMRPGTGIRKPVQGGSS